MQRSYSIDEDPDERYSMNAKEMGYAVIINNVKTEMPATIHDVERMSEALREIGFKVKEYSDLPGKEMNKVKRWMTEESTHKNCNCFSITIITHGTEDNWLCDGQKQRCWNVESVITEICEVGTLHGKPKLFFIEACRGGSTDRGVTTAVRKLSSGNNESLVLPNKQDLFVGFAAVPGYAALTTSNGSPYLQALARNLKKYHETHDLADIHLMTKKKLAKENIRDEHGIVKQGAEHRDSLLNKLHFSEFNQSKSKPAKTESKPIAKPSPIRKPSPAPVQQVQPRAVAERRPSPVPELPKTNPPPARRITPAPSSGDDELQKTDSPGLVKRMMQNFNSSKPSTPPVRRITPTQHAAAGSDKDTGNKRYDSEPAKTSTTPARRITPSSAQNPAAATDWDAVNKRNKRIQEEINKIIDRPMTKHGEIEVIPTMQPDGAASFEWTYSGPGGEERAKELAALFERLKTEGPSKAASGQTFVYQPRQTTPKMIEIKIIYIQEKKGFKTSTTVTNTINVNLPDNTTIERLKEMIKEKGYGSVKKQKLVWKNYILKSGELEAIGVKAGDTMELFIE